MKFQSRYLLGLIPLIILGAIFYYFSDIVSYVIVGWVLSMVGAPVVKFLRRFMGKNLAAGLTLAGFLLILMSLIWVFIPPLVQQARNLSTVDYNAVINSLEEPIEDWENWLKENGLMESEVIDTTVQEIAIETPEPKDQVITQIVPLDSLLNSMGDTLTRTNTNVALLINIESKDDIKPEKEEEIVSDSFFDNVRKNIYSFLNPSLIPRIFGSIVGFFGNFIIGLMSVMFISFFFLREQGLFANMISALVPNGYDQQTITALDQSSKMLVRYFIGVLTQITFITIIVSIPLSFLGIKNALLIGFFAGLMNVIPYIGPLLGASFAIIITLSSNLELSFYSELLPLMSKVLIVFMIMQMVDNFLLQPFIFGKSVKAHPLEIFIIVLMGAKLGGIPGMVLAIPAYTVLRVVAKVFLSEFKIVQRITRGMGEIE